MKTATLESNAVAVVKSEAPAKPPEREYSDFDSWLADGELLAANYARLWEEQARLAGLCTDLKDGNYIRIDEHTLWVNWPGLKGIVSKRIERFDTGCKHYNRAALYSRRADGSERILRRVVSEQIALLIGAYPNAVPHNPKIYVRLLVEEIVAAAPSAVALESACRIIRRTKKFPPTIEEMLSLLSSEGQRFVAACEASDMGDWTALRNVLRTSLNILGAELERRKGA
jgi:hypothetical protein